MLLRWRTGTAPIVCVCTVYFYIIIVMYCSRSPAAAYLLDAILARRHTTAFLQGVL